MEDNEQDRGLVISGLAYSYEQSDDRVFSLGPITSSVKPGGQIVLIGESGAGKSTLMRLLAGHLQPSQGSITVDGKQVLGPDFKLVSGDERILLMDQQPAFSPKLSIRQIILHELRHYEREWAHKEADRLLELCGISRYSHKEAKYLSGGEQQRLALAMTLATHPSVLLLDEPVSKLDHHLKSELVNAVRQIVEEEGITAIWTLHEPELTLSIADEIWVMQDGQLVQQGNPEHVYFKPDNDRVAGLLGDYNLLTEALATDLKVSHNRILRPSSLMLSEPGTGHWMLTQQVFLGYGYMNILTNPDYAGCELKVLSSDKRPVGQNYQITHS